MISALVCAVMLRPQETAQGVIAASLLTWAKESCEVMRRDFYLPSSRLYAEKWSGRLGKEPSFAWGASICLSALNSAAKYGGGYRGQQRDYVKSLETYWHKAGPVPGFSVLPKQKDPDRYYDDNAWLAIALLEASEIQNDFAFQKRAQATVDFVLSGTDSKLGGGIYWREKEKKSKNTCVNAPAAVACIALYRKNSQSKYKDRAIELYDWTRKNLRDPEDGLYWDNIRLDGSIDKTKWSYNTALMLRAAAMLYKETGDRRFFDDAKQLDLSSVMRWYAAPVSGILKDEGRFAHLLLEAWIERRKVIPDMWMPKLGDVTLANLPLSYLYNKVRDSNGHYGKRWDRDAEATYGTVELIDQASAARGFFLGAEFLAR